MKSNTVNSALTIKRLAGELRMIKKKPIDDIDAYPDPDNMFIWYFLVRGPKKSPYEGGCYIGKIMLSSGYPETPVDFMMLTPNGRFSIEKKICLTNSGYHADQWNPMWNMSVILMAFLSIMLADDTTGISHIKETDEERRIKAANSLNYNISHHRKILLGFSRFIEESNGMIRLKTFEETSIVEKKKDKKKDKKSKKENVLEVKEEEPVKKEDELVKEEQKKDSEDPVENINVLEEQQINDDNPKKKTKKKDLEEDKDPKEKMVEPKKKTIKKKEIYEEKEVEEPKEEKKKTIKKKDPLISKEEEDKTVKKTSKKEKIIVPGKKKTTKTE
ncbi:ubiquitin-conjugating enzyme E2 [Catovirus CTV1]|uniref:E2 ubiquitin-conjugating enzyme n=1 Tax=Catovirus CTV1 TaxID=1977631 RepID=A0A1V0SBT3_9VIRU|nr:ubiquitin-conjugating enzyme E2 [Catovirus CTV1]